MASKSLVKALVVLHCGRNFSKFFKFNSAGIAVSVQIIDVFSTALNPNKGVSF